MLRISVIIWMKPCCSIFIRLTGKIRTHRLFLDFLKSIEILNNYIKYQPAVWRFIFKAKMYWIKKQFAAELSWSWSVITLHICTFSWLMIMHYIFLDLLNYVDIPLDIDCKDWLRAKLHDKGDDLNFTIVNFPFICGNIPFICGNIPFICGNIPFICGNIPFICGNIPFSWFMLLNL